MKIKLQVTLMIFIFLGLFIACNGDHSTHVVRDTVANRYGTDTARTEKTNLDTSKATSADNSATGGTAAKDSSKKKIAPKK